LLSVVIPATDSPATLSRCLAALERCDEPHKLAVVTRPAGSGPAAARNAGVARAAVPLHLLHHLTAAASVPACFVLWARAARA
jgi:hypothetical protein